MRSIILNICMVAAAAALFRLLIPENNFKKQIGFLISCFFITAVVSFITGGKWELDEFYETALSFESGGNSSQSNNYTDFTGQLISAQKREIADEMSARIREVLLKNDIEPSKIYVIVNISDSYSISINEIKLVLTPDADWSKASYLTEREVGEGIKVTIEVE